MYSARIKGSNQLITIEEFKRKLGLAAIDKHELELVCPACNNALHPYGLTSLMVLAGFHHNPGTTCIYTEDRDSLFKEPGRWDLENAARLLAKLADKEFISKLYCFCHKLCGKGGLKVEKFCELIKKANSRNLWGCGGLEEWVIGFLLLVLDDFEAKSISIPKEVKYVFRFYLKDYKELHMKQQNAEDRKQSKIRIEDIWEKGNYFLYKVFASGVMTRLPEGNPYPVSREVWEEFSKNYEWIKKDLSELLLKRIGEVNGKNGNVK